MELVVGNELEEDAELEESVLEVLVEVDDRVELVVLEVEVTGVEVCVVDFVVVDE